MLVTSNDKQYVMLKTDWAYLQMNDKKYPKSDVLKKYSTKIEENLLFSCGIQKKFVILQRKTKIVHLN